MIPYHGGPISGAYDVAIAAWSGRHGMVSFPNAGQLDVALEVCQSVALDNGSFPAWKAGRPVTDLQPYLSTYAHLTAFHDGDLAFAHLHPEGAVSGEHGGPTLAFHTTFDKPGNWRLFIQFQTDGTLHTAAVTLAVR